MHGDMEGSSLIAMMENNSEEYPPFITVRDSGGTLSINKSSLKKSIKGTGTPAGTI